VVPV